MTIATEENDIGSVIQYLETIQEYYLNSNPVAVARASRLREKSQSEQLGFAEEFYNAVRDRLFPIVDFETFYSFWKRSNKRAPSRYEIPQVYSIITRQSERITLAARLLGLTLAKTPVFGTLQTGRLNGLALPIRNKNYYLILLDDGCLGIANMISKLVGEVLSESNMVPPEDSAGLIGFPIGSHIQNEYFDLLSSYVIKGDPHLSKPKIGIPPTSNLDIVSAMCDSIELFIMGHEYAHCYAGHLERGKRVDSKLAAAQGGELDLQWEDEFEADRIGAVLAQLALANDQISPVMSYFGIEAFFHIAEAINTAKTVLQGSNDISRSHPPPLERAKKLRAATSERLALANVPAHEIDAAISTADLVAQLIHGLQRRTETKFVELHRRGLRPFPGV